MGHLISTKIFLRTSFAVYWRDISSTIRENDLDDVLLTNQTEIIL
jgi:hypothetical protein